MNQKISIVMPAYNEEKRIGNTLDCYGSYFHNLKKRRLLDFNIIIVINNTHDKTEEIVKKYSRKYKEIKYLKFEKGGKGFAIIEGFKYSLEKDYDLIGFVDADMATPPEAFYSLIKNINDYDGVIASRWLKKSIIKTKQTILRKITSRTFNFLVRSLLFLRFKDTQCGAKLFKKETIGTVINELGITKWAFDVDLLYRMKKKNFKIKEIPTIWEDKKDSKLDLKRVPFQMFSSIVRLRILYSPFKGFIKLYDKMPEWMKIYHRL